jgi:hypothetical protein
MKKLTILFLLLAPLAFAEKTVKETSLKLEVKHPSGPSLSQYWLSQENGQFFCRTDHLPKHAIKPRGLKSLKSPFKSSKIASTCDATLTWGTSKACYEKFKTPLLDDVLRSCASI